MLVRSQPELALVYLRDFSQRRLEITSRFVLHASIFDEARKMVFAILASLPAKVVNVTVERKVSCRLELEAKKFLDFCLEYIEAHSIDRVLQTGVLSTVQRCLVRRAKLNKKITHSARLPLSFCTSIIFSATI